MPPLSIMFVKHRQSLTGTGLLESVLLIIRTLLLTTLLVSGGSHASGTTVSFSTEKSGDDPPVKTGETEFTCSDTIYALVETQGIAAGIHDIEIHWFDPRDERQELTRFSAQVFGDGTLIWAWLRLHAPDGAGMVRAFDPSLGMRGFIGRWTVKVYIDDKQVTTGTFDVLC